VIRDRRAILAPPQLADAKAKVIDGVREIAVLPLFRRAVLGYAVYTAAVVDVALAPRR
jgi:hypothetical protein